MNKRIVKYVSLTLTVCLLIGCMSIAASAVGITYFYLLGDINNDGAVTTDDARLALRYAVYLEDDENLAKLSGEDYEYLYAMDANRDNSLDTADARLILRMAVGLENKDDAPYTYDKAAVDAICDEYEAYGVQAAVIRNGKVIDTYNYGVADASTGREITDNTKFRASSLSKLVTFATCMALVDRGVLDLDEDISEYFGFTVRNPYYPNEKITLRMLMTHSASIADGNSFNASMDGGSSYSIKYLLSDRGNYLWAKPGEESEYSNFGAALVGCICELATGRCFEDLAQEYIIDPLGLDAGYVSSSLADKTYAKIYSGGYENWGASNFNNAKYSSVIGQTVHIVQGNLLITADDYAKVLSMLLNGGLAENGTRVLSQSAVNEMLIDQYVDDYEVVGFATYIIPSLYDGMTHYTHTGSSYGFHGAYAMDKDYKNGVVVFTSGCARSLDESTYIYNVCQAIIYELMPAFE